MMPKPKKIRFKPAPLVYEWLRQSAQRRGIPTSAFAAHVCHEAMEQTRKDVGASPIEWEEHLNVRREE